MAGSTSPQDSSERLWPSPYSPTATLSTAKSVPQPTFVQTRNSIQSRPQQVRTQSPKPRDFNTNKSPEINDTHVNNQGDGKAMRLWPSPYSKKSERSHDANVGQTEEEQDQAGRERVDETPEPESSKGVEMEETRKSIWKRLLCLGCFR